LASRRRQAFVRKKLRKDQEIPETL
jgi:hypothetical protein